MRTALFTLALLAVGCTSRPMYLEGTHLALGAYIPTLDSLYGVELVQYTSGCLLYTGTNSQFEVLRTYNATNSYLWGMVNTIEHTETKVDVK